MFPAKMKMTTAVKLVAGLLMVFGSWAISARLLHSQRASFPTSIQEYQKQSKQGDPQADPLPVGAVQRLGSLRFRQGSSISTLAYSPDGKMVASGGENGEVWVWDRATGKRLHRLQKHTMPIRAVGFSSDGTKLVSSAYTIGTFQGRMPASELILWELAKTLPLRQRKESVFLFSPDGKVLYTGGEKALVLSAKVPPVHFIPSGAALNRFDAATGKELKSFGKGYPVAVSPDGKQLATVLIMEKGRGQTLFVWDTNTGKELRCLVEESQRIVGACFSPKGLCYWTRAVFTDLRSEKTVWFWSAQRKKPVKLLEVGKQSFDFVFTRDGKRVAWKEADRLRVWDLVARTDVCRISSPLLSYKVRSISTFAVSPDGTELVTGNGSRGSLVFWDVRAGKEIDIGKGHKGLVLSVKVSPDGGTIYSVSSDGTLRFWDRKTGKQIYRIDHPTHGWFGGADLSPDGKLIAVASDHVYVWRTRDRKLAMRLPVPKDKARYLAFSPDGKFLAAILVKKCQAALWETATGKLVWRTEFDMRPKGNHVLYRLAFSSDGRFVGVVGSDASVRLLQPQTGKILKRIEHPKKSSFTSVAFSPDGRTLATGDGRIIWLWELATAKQRLQIKTSQRHTRSLAFSPDGRTLVAGCVGDKMASGYYDTKLYRWDARSGKETHHFGGHRHLIPCVSFSRDGEHLVSGSWDTTLLVWKTPAFAPTNEKLSKEQRNSLWAILANADAEAAYQAQRKLSADRNSVEFLNGKLKPVRSVQSQEITQWIKDLDSKSFNLRRAAQSRLTEYVDQAARVLRKALKKPPNLEVKRRLTKILEQLHRPHGERPQALRAIEVLEWIGTPEAKKLVNRVAGGAATAQITQDAQAAEGRMGKTHRPQR